MKLSVYVNYRSIGWVVTDHDEVIDKGIKRINIDFDTHYEYISGAPVSKMVSRRMKRQARRNLHRYQSRRRNLLNTMERWGWVYSATYSGEQLMQLRVKALSEQLSGNELAAVMASLIRNRGYKSMRGLENSDESQYLEQIHKNEESLATNYLSIADMILHIGPHKNMIFLRESYEREFRQICEAQSLIDDAKRKKLHSLIYFQRAIKHNNVGKCKQYGLRKVCHASHPLYQKFRCMRDANNVRIFDQSNSEVDIPLSVRWQWFNRLYSGKNLTKAAACKDLGIKKSTGYSWLSGKQLEGNFASQITQYDNAEELWQDIFSATDDAKLRTLLTHKYSDIDIEAAVDINLAAAGWGDYCLKAVKELIPMLEAGNTLKEAVLVKYGVVDPDLDVSLRNLVLQQHYDSYRSLVLALSNKYSIEDVAVEISPMLKAGNKQRKQMAISARKQQKKMETSSYTPYQQHLVDLWEECGKVSPYEPDKKIDLDDLLANYNVDHIVPKSKLFEHGIVNQTICRRDMNEAKSSLTGIEFARKLGIEDAYLKCINGLKISDRKRQFFLMATEDVPTSYLDTLDYNSKCFALSASYVIPGKIVNKYYRDWKLDIYPDSDCRCSLMKALVIANFDEDSIAYFNKLVMLGPSSVGRYKLTQRVVIQDLEDVVPYMPRIKYYRRTKFGCIPRGALHKESIYGQRTELIRNTKGQLVKNIYYKIRKPVLSLTEAMFGKVMDKNLRMQLDAIRKNRTFNEVKEYLTEHPLMHNGNPVHALSVRVNATELIQLPYGYAYAGTYHRVMTDTGTAVSLFEYIGNVNSGVNYSGKCLKANDILLYNGKYYFIIGAGSIDSMMMRSVYELDAANKIRVNKKILNEATLVRVNQIGEIKEEGNVVTKNS